MNSAEKQETHLSTGIIWGVWLPLAAIAAIGFGLRLLRWTADELWPDEAFLGYVSGLSLREILPLTWHENSPPLPHFLVAISERLFGPGEAALRLPSLIGGSLLPPATYLAGRSLLGRRVGLFAGIIVALSPIHIFYSQMARAYAFLPLLALASAVSLYHLLDRRRASDVAIYAASTAAAIYAHQWGLLLLPAAYVYALIARIPGGPLRLLLPHGIAALLCLPILPAVQPNPHQQAIVRSFYSSVWEATPPPLAIPRSLEALWAGGLYPSQTTVKIAIAEEAVRADPRGPFLRAFAAVPRWPWRVACWISLVYLLGAGLLARRDDALGASGVKGKRLVMMAYLMTPLILAWIVSFLITPVYLVGRHDVMVLPFLGILAGMGLAKLRRGLGLAAIAAYVLLAASSLVPFYVSEHDDGNRARAKFLQETVRPGDVVIYTGYRQNPIEYYLRPETLPGASFTFPSVIGEWRAGIPFETLRAEPGRIQKDAWEVVKKCEARRGPGGAVYLVPSAGEWVPAIVPVLASRLFGPELLLPGRAEIYRFVPRKGEK